MKIFRVQYTVKEDYVAANQANIRRVMSDLKALDNPNIRYSTFLDPDGKSFMHLAMYPDDATAKIVNELPAFVKFRTELMKSQPEKPPQVENLTMVGSSFEVFV